MQQLKSRIEAVLFVTAKALSLEEISEYVEREPEECEEALLELIMDYSSREGALEVDDEDGYILQVRQEHLDIVEKLCDRIMIIKKGKIRAEVTLEELKERGETLEEFYLKIIDSPDEENSPVTHDDDMAEVLDDKWFIKKQKTKKRGAK